MNGTELWFNGWGPIVRIVVVGSLAYFSLVLLLRITNKHSLTRLNAFDFIISVAIGAAFGRILTARQVVYSEAVTAFVLLVALQYLATWLRLRFPQMARLLSAPPTLLFYGGKPIPAAMRQQHVTETELQSVVRRRGIASMDAVEAIVMESNGKFGVIKKQDADDHSLIDAVDASSG